MPHYRLSGHELFFPYDIRGLKGFSVEGTVPAEMETLNPDSEAVLLSRNMSEIAGEYRQVEVWSAPPGTVLRVSGGTEFYVTSSGKTILPVGKAQSLSALSPLDREILLGPVLVLALAMRGTWSLHASAVMYQDKTIAFVGESGRGKSTLAAFLSQADWRLVADDILPVTLDESNVHVWPHFPQLKLPIDQQPGVSLPEQLPLNIICQLATAGQEEIPEMNLLSPGQVARVLLSHIAGTRLFDKLLLEKYLDFCARAAGYIPVYRLAYPHRKDALPKIKGLLENLC